jgi:hypothetical protein
MPDALAAPPDPATRQVPTVVALFHGLNRHLAAPAGRQRHHPALHGTWLHCFSTLKIGRSAVRPHPWPPFQTSSDLRRHSAEHCVFSILRCPGTGQGTSCITRIRRSRPEVTVNEALLGGHRESAGNVLVAGPHVITRSRSPPGPAEKPPVSDHRGQRRHLEVSASLTREWRQRGHPTGRSPHRTVTSSDDVQSPINQGRPDGWGQDAHDDGQNSSRSIKVPVSGRSGRMTNSMLLLCDPGLGGDVGAGERRPPHRPTQMQIGAHPHPRKSR